MPKLPALVCLAAGCVLVAGPADPASAAGKKPDVGKLTKDLAAADPNVQAAALADLAKLGQVQKAAIKDAIPAMVRALASKDATVRAAAARAVGMIDPDPTDAVPRLVKLLTDDKDEAVRVAAAQGLGAMGPAAKDATKELREATKQGDGKGKVNNAARNALKTINPKKK